MKMEFVKLCKYEQSTLIRMFNIKRNKTYCSVVFKCWWIIEKNHVLHNTRVSNIASPPEFKLKLSLHM